MKSEENEISENRLSMFESIKKKSTKLSWININSVNWFQLLCIKVVKTGKIPDHIAFIMDGNRRYAKKNNVDREEGHKKGFEKLAETLKWCLDLGIRECTVYAFSIENFKRSKEEVDTLMRLADEKFQRLIDEVEQMQEWGVRVHIAGRLELLPDNIKAKAARVMTETKNHNRLRLNVAYAYTGRDEIARAISTIERGVQNGMIDSSHIDEKLIESCLELSNPGLLVRTSGETRLSDYMLWQVSDTILYFTDVLWPDFSIWNLLAAILHYQRYCKESDPMESETARCPKVEKFLKYVEEDRLEKLEEYSRIRVI